MEKTTRGANGTYAPFGGWSLPAPPATIDRLLCAETRYLAQRNINIDVIKANINDIIVKTIIACEPKIVGRLNSTRVPQKCIYELFGYDVLLDANLRPWLIEVNGTP